MCRIGMTQNILMPLRSGQFKDQKSSKFEETILNRFFFKLQNQSKHIFTRANI